MKYMGSKARVAKEILPIILQGRKEGQWYVEPFCGGCNVIDKVDGLRLANDKNIYLIAMWEGLKHNRRRPTTISKELYNSARDEYNRGVTEKFDTFQIGWIGWMGSANGRFFDGGYSGTSNTKVGTVRDYITESINNITKQIDSVRDVIFSAVDYSDMVYPPNSIIYCDIPYQGTKQYSTSSGFNHCKFWDWAREMSLKGHFVYVSEYNAPSDFQCIWSKDVKSSLSANAVCGGSKDSVEKLFKLKVTN